jgi:hypothetical protein
MKQAAAMSSGQKYQAPRNPLNCLGLHRGPQNCVEPDNQKKNVNKGYTEPLENAADKEKHEEEKPEWTPSERTFFHLALSLDIDHVCGDYILEVAKKLVARKHEVSFYGMTKEERKIIKIGKCIETHEPCACHPAHILYSFVTLGRRIESIYGLYNEYTPV